MKDAKGYLEEIETWRAGLDPFRSGLTCVYTKWMINEIHKLRQAESDAYSKGEKALLDVMKINEKLRAQIEQLELEKLR